MTNNPVKDKLRIPRFFSWLFPTSKTIEVPKEKAEDLGNLIKDGETPENIVSFLTD